LAIDSRMGMSERPKCQSHKLKNPITINDTTAKAAKRLRIRIVIVTLPPKRVYDS
jgi:hypothetical protein